MVAGPATIVAGTRAGVKFGFETSLHRLAHSKSSHIAASRRIALGWYGAEELLSMFNQDSLSSFNSTMGSCASFSVNASSATNVRKSSDTQVTQLDRGGQRRGPVLTKAEAEEIFSKLDTNSHGKISMIQFVHSVRTNPEIAHRLQLPTEHHREYECRDMFQHVFGDVDLDMSKNISLNDFVAYYEQRMAPLSKICNAGCDPNYDELENIIAESNKQVIGAYMCPSHRNFHGPSAICQPFLSCC